MLRALASAAPRSRELFLVGGAVRDVLRERLDGGRGRRAPRAPLDLDVATDRDALAIARRVAQRTGGTVVVLDAERGAARVVVDGAILDVTDFRAPTLEADLRARDYTVDAVAVSVGALLAAGRAPLIDPTGGVADLRARRLALPRPGVIADDPLRAVRGVRLEAVLGFRLSAAAVAEARNIAPRVAGIAAERVRDELLIMLGRPTAARSLRRLDALGLLGVIVPDVEAMRRTAQPAPHRFDVLEHSLRAVGAVDRLIADLEMLEPFTEELRAHVGSMVAGGVDRVQVLKMAALLHDVAKPETRRAAGGRVRFFDHDVIGAERARAICVRLRLPERVVALVARLVRHHLRPMHLGQAEQVSRRARYRFYRDLGDAARDLLVLALADAAAVTGVAPSVAWRRSPLVRDLLAGLEQEHAAAVAPPLVRGEDVMARFGLEPGPEVGRLLARAREAQALGVVTTREQALAYLDSSRAPS